MTVAGFVSTEKKWLRFEREWNDVLTKYEVPYLHMKEFAHSVRAFDGWKGQEDKRKSLLIELIKVAKKGVRKGFVVSVRLQDYDEVNSDFRLREHWGNAYSFIGMGVVSDAMEWKKKHFPHAPIKFVFEDGDVGQSDLKRCLRSEALAYSFIPKQEKQNDVIRYITPFQLADFAAWENQIAFSRFHDGHYDNVDLDDPVKLLRQSWQALYKQIPSDPKAFSNEGLRSLCQSKHLHLPSSSSLSSVVDNHPASLV